MRILIATGIFPPDKGGPATHIPQIAQVLADRGHDITIVTLTELFSPLLKFEMG